MCNSNYPLIPLTTKTIEKCNNACNGRTGIQDDICCFNCVFWPITFILDIVLCPCLYGYYKYQKTQNKENDEITSEQPV